MKKLEIEVTRKGSIVKYTLPFETDEKALDFALKFSEGLKPSTQQDAGIVKLNGKKVEVESIRSVPPTPPAMWKPEPTTPASEEPASPASPASPMESRTPAVLLTRESSAAAPPRDETPKRAGVPKTTPPVFRPIEARTPSYACSSIFGVIQGTPSPRYSAFTGGSIRQEQEEETMTVLKIFKTAGARSLLLRAWQPEPLTPAMRKTAINTIADHFIQREQKLTLKECRDFESQLLNLFPGEEESDYRTDRRGKIYIRYKNKCTAAAFKKNVNRKLFPGSPTTPVSPMSVTRIWSQGLPEIFDEIDKDEYKNKYI
ncbi:uncharacterized protein LOC111074934 [Drosophila obscura]|uniref:uncharacterized protein LOC111074934 n=1 Tax=Drosophila obscura TaxID=7282 RepID=UPI001BB27C24|nr:uncharacterized protein LOC111074934 [Drosophila obscura]